LQPRRFIGLVFVLGGPANVAQREAQRLEGQFCVFLDRIAQAFRMGLIGLAASVKPSDNLS
jgi:hypothetical protein